MTSLYLRPWNRYPPGVVPCSATCLSIASLTYSGSGTSRNSPAWRNFSGRSCAAGLTCSFTRRVLPWLIRQRRLTARASPIRSPQPCMSQMVAAQSGGSPAATASICACAGMMKSAQTTTPGSWTPVHGDSASFLSRTASARTALIQPGFGLGAEQHLPGLGVDEYAGALVVLDLEREVLGFAPVITEGLLALAAGPASGRAVADHPLVRAALPPVFGAGAAFEDSGHGGYTSRDWSHSSTCRSRNRRYRPTQ